MLDLGRFRHEIEDAALGPGHVGQGLTQHGIDDGARLGGGQFAQGIGQQSGTGTGAPTGGHQPVDRSFHVEQAGGHVHEQRIVLGLITGRDQGIDGIGLAQGHLPGLGHTQHGHGIGHAMQLLHLGLEILHPGLGAVHEHVQAVLDLGQVLADGAGDRVHQLLIGAADVGQGLFQVRALGQQLVEAEGTLDRAHLLAAGTGAGHVVEQVLDQVTGDTRAQGGLAVLDQHTHLAVDAPQQLLDRDAGLQGAAAEGLGDGTAHPEQTPHGIVPGGPAQVGDHRLDALQALGYVAVAEQTQQTELVVMAAAACQFTDVLAAGSDLGLALVAIHDAFHVREEQHVLGHQAGVAGGAKIVEQGQQDDGDVPMPGLDVFKVIGQLQDGPHQHLEGVVTAGDTAVAHRLGEAHHLLGEQGSAVQLHHLQGAVDLSKLGLRVRQLVGLGVVLDVGLQRDARLVEQRVQLLLHPVQGAVLDGLVSHGTPGCLWERANGGSWRLGSGHLVLAYVQLLVFLIDDDRIELLRLGQLEAGHRLA